MSDREIIEKTKEFAEAFGGYIRAMAVLAEHKKDVYYDISHDAQQGFTWIYKLLSGGEVSAWGTNTEGIIEKCRKAKGVLYEKAEKLKKESSKESIIK